MKKFFFNFFLLNLIVFNLFGSDKGLLADVEYVRFASDMAWFERVSVPLERADVAVRLLLISKTSDSRREFCNVCGRVLVGYSLPRIFNHYNREDHRSVLIGLEKDGFITDKMLAALDAYNEREKQSAHRYRDSLRSNPKSS